MVFVYSLGLSCYVGSVRNVMLVTASASLSVCPVTPKTWFFTHLLPSICSLVQGPHVDCRAFFFIFSFPEAGAKS